MEKLILSPICLFDFRPIRPLHELPQEDILRWVAKAHTQSKCLNENWDIDFHTTIEEKLFKLGAGIEKVQSRGVQMRDCVVQEWQETEIFQLHTHPQGLGLKERMFFFERAVDSVFEQFYLPETPSPDHLIHVSCTGYVSPSGAQKLVSKRGWGEKTTVTHAYHMGCYASLPALRMASGFLSSCSSIDIVHTELCSIHMDPALHATDQLVIQSLFADGFIKYSVKQSNDLAHPHLKILSLREEIIPNSTGAMIWRCEDWGFRMGIAKEVPVLIRRALKPFLQRLLKDIDPQRKLIFAIHPGGPKIIEQIGQLLDLTQEQVCHSQMILRNFGNMSSATLPHVWHAMLEDEAIEKNQLIVSLAFGPGLTISGALLEKGGT